MSPTADSTARMVDPRPSQAASPLARADQAALALSDSQAVGATAMPCPFASKDEKKVIEIIVVGEDGKGLDGIDLLITRGDGQVLSGKTGAAGWFRFKGVDPGSYRLRLPDLDKEAWLVKSTQALPEAEARHAGTAPWRSRPAPAPASALVHHVQQGECVAKIAERYGFFPGTIWEHAANADLRKSRRDNLYILFPGDQVVIPGKRQQDVSVAAGDRMIVQRRGVPERLRIRFLDEDGKPRAGVAYLLNVTTRDGSPVKAVAGNTTEDGFVDQPIPPSAVTAEIMLVHDLEPETYQFDVGYIDPIDTPSGVVARLNNLGYRCGQIADGAPANLAPAIRAFQYRSGIECTGILDAATRDLLERRHGS